MSRILADMERRRLGTPEPTESTRKPRRTRADIVAEYVARGVDPALVDQHRAHEKQIADARRLRKRAVKAALATGRTVPFDLRTLIEDGWSVTTIKRVLR